MPELRFDQQVVVVTDVNSGLGDACASFLASRGSSVVINELPRGTNELGSFSARSPPKTVDILVDKIRHIGGNAIATCESLANGGKIVDKAISEYGRIDILINNASFDGGENDGWDSMLDVNVKGAYKCARAAWPHFRKQKYGRVINIASLLESARVADKICCSAGKLSQLGLTETLAKEGVKYNIAASMIVPMAPSYITGLSIPATSTVNHAATVSLVAVLAHPSKRNETGSMFEVGDKQITKFRWERAAGALLKPDETLTPRALLMQWRRINDFSQASHPYGPADIKYLMAKAHQLESHQGSEQVQFRGKVVLITGAGGGLGRAYARAFASQGASVVVNDLKDPCDVVHDIRANGGTAVASIGSVEDGAAAVETAITAYGRLDIVINNAGFVRDKAFINMDDASWDPVINVHMRGTYNVTKAAWPYFVKQNYGRVVNTTSTSGIYGSFGQANYSAAKLGILGLSDAFAREGSKHDIRVNTIAPIASTGGLAAALGDTPGSSGRDFKPEYIAPLVMLLSSDILPKPATGGLYEVSGGWHARTRLQRSVGYDPSHINPTPEAVLEAWNEIITFNNRKELILQGPTEQKKSNQDILENIERLKNTIRVEPTYIFDDKDVLLYNLGVGAKRSDLSLLFEGLPNFQVLPTFGAMPFFSPSVISRNADLVPNFDVMRMVHGENYLELRKFPIPTSGTLTTTSRLLNVIDKDIFYNELPFFIRGSGGFGRQDSSLIADCPVAASLTYMPPPRQPDAVIEDRTSDEQAARYRLSGDRMAMHIDPVFSARAGFQTPILHGLCFFGFAGRHVFEQYGAFRISRSGSQGRCCQGRGYGRRCGRKVKGK